MTSIKPVISEKTMQLTRLGQYTFSVGQRISKIAIAKDIARTFGVPVVAVRVLNLPGKVKLTRGKRGSRSPVRKLIVRLKQGHSLPGWEVTKPTDNNQEQPAKSSR